MYTFTDITLSHKHVLKIGEIARVARGPLKLRKISLAMQKMLSTEDSYRPLLTVPQRGINVQMLSSEDSIPEFCSHLTGNDVQD